jgi:hypothetical protein
VQVLSVGIVAVALVLAALLIGPMLTSGRDLSTPASRLVGHWESQTDRVMTHAIYGPVNASGAGTCYNPDGSVHFTFKVLYEDPTGTRLVLSEGENESTQIETEYIIAPDGRSMTKEYKYGDGNPWVFDYEYQGRR